MAVIAEEVAREQLEKMITAFGADLDPENKHSLLRAISAGRLDFDETEESFTIMLVKPIQLENGETVETLIITEPDFSQVQKASKSKNEIDQTLFLLSSITGHPAGVIGRLKMRDLTLCGTVLSFFA